MGQLRLYNTLTRRKEDFRPLDPPRVRMYNCGPTVYNYAHIGNMSAFMLADVLRRYLEWKGFEVTQVMNVTDVGHMTVDDVADGGGEDKLEATARREKRDPFEIARFYERAFREDLATLGMLAAHRYPRATEHVPEMVALIEKLFARGHAYRAGEGDVYFDVQSFPAYGRFSGNALEELVAGARVEVREEKRHPADFALWKVDPKHIMQWDTPWGRGFPGWHIECSAMGMKYLGETFDIHTGGEDHIFPHHECEVAQSEGATGNPFVRYWLHTRFLLVASQKMAKRTGNFYTVRDLTALGWTGREIRYALLSTHYRTQQNFTFEALAAARAALERIGNFVGWLADLGAGRPGAETPTEELAPASDLTAPALARFEEALDDDLNASGALAALFDLIKQAYKSLRRTAEDAVAVREAFERMNRVFGLGRAISDVGSGGLVVGGSAGGGVILKAEVDRLVAEREAARKARDFARADAIRKELLAKGITVTDTPAGPRWKSE